MVGRTLHVIGEKDYTTHENGSDAVIGRYAVIMYIPGMKPCLFV